MSKNKKVPLEEYLRTHGQDQTKLHALYTEPGEEWLRATVLQYLEAQHKASGNTHPFVITPSQLDTAVRVLRRYGDITALFEEQEET